MKPTTKFYIVLSLIVLTTASCGPLTPAATATQIEATRPVAPAPTRTREPTPTATSPEVEELFVRPTMHPFGGTPTPIATPDSDNSLISLRTPSEENALNLILAMNEYSYQSFPPLPGWWTEGNFVASQRTVALAIQEYLYRFPEGSDAERLHWQLAFINSLEYSGLPGNQYGDDWIVAELERRLNQGEALPDQLENILGQYWFDVAYLQPIENLFKDGKTAWLYEITIQAWEESEIEAVTDSTGRALHGGLFFVVRQSGPGKFQLFPLSSAWSFSFAESSVFDTTDHNENGIPEIALYIGYHSGTMCRGDLLIYEWKIDSFAQLTNGQLSLGDCGEFFQYSKTNGVPSITFSGMFARPGVHLYTWNGEFYEFSRYLDATPLEVWKYSLIGSRISYQEEIGLLSEILRSDELDNPAFADYLRYRLGTIYAFDGQSNEARRELEDLVSSPLDTTRTIFPDMAQKFLERYRGQMSLYDACHQSQLVYNNALDPAGNSDLYPDDDTYKEIIGFPRDLFLYVPVECNEEDAFRLSVNSVSTTMKNIPAELRKMGVDLDFSQRMDANLDGEAEEWLIVFDTYNQYLVLPGGSHYQAKELNTSIGDEVADYSSARVSVEAWPNFPNPIMVFRAGQELELLEIDDGYGSKSLFHDFDIVKYSISNQTGIPQLQVFYSDPNADSYYPDHPWGGYRLDVEKRNFRDDLLEYTLFVLRDPEQAAGIADQMFPVLERWKNIPDIDVWSLPYTYYVTGLSYELSGDQQKAAQVYWQLWRDFPDSPYARMARYKLASVVP